MSFSDTCINSSRNASTLSVQKAWGIIAYWWKPRSNFAYFIFQLHFLSILRRILHISSLQVCIQQVTGWGSSNFQLNKLFFFFLFSFLWLKPSNNNCVGGMSSALDLTSDKGSGYVKCSWNILEITVEWTTLRPHKVMVTECHLSNSWLLNWRKKMLTPLFLQLLQAEFTVLESFQCKDCSVDLCSWYLVFNIAK